MPFLGPFRHVNDRELPFIAHLPSLHLTRSCRAFSQTLTTPALNRRSSRWFAASSCKAAAEGLPPSLTQHRPPAERTYAIRQLPFRTRTPRLLKGIQLSFSARGSRAPARGAGHVRIAAAAAHLPRAFPGTP